MHHVLQGNVLAPQLVQIQLNRVLNVLHPITQLTVSRLVQMYQLHAQVFLLNNQSVNDPTCRAYSTSAGFLNVCVICTDPNAIVNPSV